MTFCLSFGLRSVPNRPTSEFSWTIYDGIGNEKKMSVFELIPTELNGFKNRPAFCEDLSSNFHNLLLIFEKLR